MSTLQISIAQQVARVTLNRPEVRNALNDVLIAELTQAFATLGARDDVRCIVLSAQGPTFCAGADLHWMQKMADCSQAENLADAAQLAQLLRTMALCPKPTLAQVQGDVWGGGVGLVAACDMAVSIDQAQYGLSEVKLGLVPSTISPYVLRAIGARAAQRYFLTAERFSAQEAERIGLIHAVATSPAALQSQVDAWTQALAQASLDALAECKQLIARVAGQPIDAGLIAHTVQVLADRRASRQGREGIAAFLQKRKPGWVG